MKSRTNHHTLVILALIFLAIHVGFFILRSGQKTISSTAEERRLKMTQNLSPLATEQVSAGAITSQLFGRDKTDLYVSNIRDASIASSEFLDLYFSPTLRPTLKRRREVIESLDLKHVFYEQQIEGISVYGSHVAVHVKDGNIVRGATTAVVASTVLEPERILQQVASQTAFDTARGEFKNITTWRVVETKKIVFNNSLMGYSDDARNIPALKVDLATDPAKDYANYTYIISLTDGSILDRFSQDLEVMQRTVHNCPNHDPNRPSTVICTGTRNEGQPATGVVEQDEAYDSFGQIYAKIYQTFGIKSFDNNDGLLLGRVNLPPQVQSGSRKPCENGNAWWNVGSKSMFYCAGWVSLDISAHEIGHGLVFNYLPDLGFTFQTGAINEGVADIIGALVDSEDWNMGEDSPKGIIRHLENPPAGRRPDRMFSEYFGCTANDEPASSSNDQGYIHKNATILGKGFFLMSQGGTFNGCTMQGMGREEAAKIVFKAVSGGYITPTANFKTYYDALNAACAELHGASSAQCQTVINAAKATEIDQQPASSQRGPKCMGTAPKPPSCSPQVTTVPTTAPTVPPTAGPTAGPSPSPAPTSVPSPTPQSTTAPTNTPSVSCEKKSKGDADCNGQVSLTDYALWKTEFKGGCSITALTPAACGDDRDGNGLLMDADFSGDFNVSLVDFGTWKTNFQ